MRFRWHHRFGLTSRIVIVILLSQVSIELFQNMLKRLVPPPSFILIDQQWLSERTAEAIRVARDTPAEKQQEKLDTLASAGWLSFHIEAGDSKADTSAPRPAGGVLPPARHHVSAPMPGKSSSLLTSVVRDIAQKIDVDPARIQASAETTSTDIDLETGTLVVLAASLPTRLVDVDTMHALTIHKSQGSQVDEVTVLLPPADSRLLSRELFYTAITRARRVVRVVGSEETVRAAVRRRVQRASGLAARLAHESENET